MDDSHCDRITFSLIPVHVFDNGYVGKQPEEYCVQYWLKELKESMDRCTGHCNTPETVLKTAVHTIESAAQMIGLVFE